MCTYVQLSVKQMIAYYITSVTKSVAIKS